MSKSTDVSSTPTCSCVELIQSDVWTSSLSSISGFVIMSVLWMTFLYFSSYITCITNMKCFLALNHSKVHVESLLSSKINFFQSNSGS